MTYTVAGLILYLYTRMFCGSFLRLDLLPLPLSHTFYWILEIYLLFSVFLLTLETVSEGHDNSCYALHENLEK